MLNLIDSEREGSEVDRTPLKSCVELFEAMGMGSLDVYKSDFEDKLIESTQAYYARKTSEWTESNGAAYSTKVGRLCAATIALP